MLEAIRKAAELPRVSSRALISAVTLTAFGWFVGHTMKRMEDNPDSGLATTWEQVRTVWNEHEMKIYLGIGVPLVLIVVVYVVVQRRKKRNGA